MTFQEKLKQELRDAELINRVKKENPINIKCLFWKEGFCNSDYNKGVNCNGFNPQENCPYNQQGGSSRKNGRPSSEFDSFLSRNLFFNTPADIHNQEEQMGKALETIPQDSIKAKQLCPSKEREKGDGLPFNSPTHMPLDTKDDLDKD